MSVYRYWSILKNNLKKSKLAVDLVNSARRIKNKGVKKDLINSGERIAFEILEALRNSDCNAVVTYGTLLGVVREGRFLDYDSDIDIMILFDETSSWEAVERAMISLGYRLIRYFEIDGTITEQTYKKHHIAIDIFAAERIQGTNNVKMYYYARQRNTIYNSPEDTTALVSICPFSGATHKVAVGNYTFNVPDDAEAFLEAIYGPSWRIPDPEWSDEESYFTIVEGSSARRVVLG